MPMNASINIRSIKAIEILLFRFWGFLYIISSIMMSSASDNKREISQINCFNFVHLPDCASHIKHSLIQLLTPLQMELFKIGII